MRTFTDLTPEGARFFAQLAKVTKAEVKAGFPEGSGGYGDGQSLAEVAAWNDLGTASIPAKPFLERSFQDHRDRLEAVCDAALQALNQGGTAEASLDRVGQGCVEVIRREIDGGGFGSNAWSTIRAKGFDRPLIETGYLRSSVDYRIETGGSV